MRIWWENVLYTENTQYQFGESQIINSQESWEINLSPINFSWILVWLSKEWRREDAIANFLFSSKPQILNLYFLNLLIESWEMDSQFINFLKIMGKFQNLGKFLEIS